MSVLILKEAETECKLQTVYPKYENPLRHDRMTNLESEILVRSANADHRGKLRITIPQRIIVIDLMNSILCVKIWTRLIFDDHKMINCFTIVSIEFRTQ